MYTDTRTIESCKQHKSYQYNMVVDISNSRYWVYGNSTSLQWWLCPEVTRDCSVGGDLPVHILRLRRAVFSLVISSSAVLNRWRRLWTSSSDISSSAPNLIPRCRISCNRKPHQNQQCLNSVLLWWHERYKTVLHEGQNSGWVSWTRIIKYNKLINLHSRTNLQLLISANK